MLSRKACHLITTARDDNLLLFPRGWPQDQEGQKPVSRLGSVPQPSSSPGAEKSCLGGTREEPGERWGRQPTPGLRQLENLLSAGLCTGAGENPNCPPSTGCKLSACWDTGQTMNFPLCQSHTVSLCAGLSLSRPSLRASPVTGTGTRSAPPGS